MYNSEQVKELLKKQRENCKRAYLMYYAGSEEDSAPQCVVDDIENAPEPEDFVLNDKRNVARGEEKSCKDGHLWLRHNGYAKCIRCNKIVT